MRIGIFTNTFLPHIGGVARSVRNFLEDYRRAGHRVLVVAPEFPQGPAPRHIERSVERVPAWRNFNGSDFSVSLPVAAELAERIRRFRPQIVHAQHPFLLGDTALRVAAESGVPAVFTHHTLYERYTHYLPFDSERLQSFVAELATRFANCCDGVIAPSASLARLLEARGVTSPIRVVPTGIDTEEFSAAARGPWRARLGLDGNAVLVGHVGRLAVEKNLPFLAEALARFLSRVPRSRALIVGDGPARPGIEEAFAQGRVGGRVLFTGSLTGRPLREAYAAMDLFAFSSQSETQGMVLTEAMAAGVPVVALDASGVRDVVRDRENGRLLPADATVEALARALARAARDPDLRASWREGARRTAEAFDRRVTARLALAFYRELIARHPARPRGDAWETRWQQLRDRIVMEGRLLGDKLAATTVALAGDAPSAWTGSVAR